MWLTGHKIREAIINKDIKIEPYHDQYINPNSYNYTLFPVLKRIKNEVIDLKEDDEYEEIVIPPEGYVLQPNECYLGCTNEIFHSDKYASLVTGRSSIGRKFVTNHITAGLIDQGFEGRITLEIVVVKPTRVYPNIPFGQVYWFKTIGMPMLYNGKYQNQNVPEISKVSQDFVNSIKSKKLYIVPEMWNKKLKFEEGFFEGKIKKPKSKLELNKKFENNLKKINKKELIDRVEITGGNDPLEYDNIEELIDIIKNNIKTKIKLYTRGNKLKDIPLIDEINLVVLYEDKFKEVLNKIEYYKKRTDKIRICVPLNLSKKQQLELIKIYEKYVDEIVFRVLKKNNNKQKVAIHKKVKIDLIEFDNPKSKSIVIGPDNKISEGFEK